MRFQSCILCFVLCSRWLVKGWKSKLLAFQNPESNSRRSRRPRCRLAASINTRSQASQPWNDPHLKYTKRRQSYLSAKGRDDTETDYFQIKGQSEAVDHVSDDSKELLEEEELWELDDEGRDTPVIMKNDDGNLALNSSLSPILIEDFDLGAFSSNVSYFYLQNELGLSDAAMWKITHEAGSALGMTADTIRRKVDVLRETMDLDDNDIRTILERQPTILHLSADKNISPTILFLLRSLELGRDELRSLVVASPSILCYSKANLNSKINFFTRLMNYSTQECRELLLSEPKLLRAGVQSGLVPRMRYLLRDMEIPMSNLRLIVQKHPRILLYSLDNNLVPKLIFYLIMTLHMDTSQVQKLLMSYPVILDYNLDRHLLPITRYFLQDLEVSPIEFRGILLKFPRIMSHSLQKIKHVVGYLRFELGLTGFQVKRVLYQAPQVIGLNTEANLHGKVEFLETSFDLSQDQVRSVVSGMPTLLVLSLEKNLEPKMKYLRRCFGNNQDALRATILRLPTLLGYSLDKRIRPRLDAILKAGLDPSSITVGIPMKQEKFEGWLKRRQKKLWKERSAIVAVKQPSQDRSGRIVHWTRERRPPPQSNR